MKQLTLFYHHKSFNTTNYTANSLLSLVGISYSSIHISKFRLITYDKLSNMERGFLPRRSYVVYSSDNN